MTWNTILGIASIAAFFFPVTVIIYNRFYRHRSLAALLVYYILMALYNMMAENIIPVSASTRSLVGIIDNYLDTPLMMAFLLFFCPNKQKQNRVFAIGALFAAYEIIITCIHGFTQQSVIYILAPGFIVVLTYSTFLFVRQIKFTILHGKNTGRTLMLASILFVYSCYALIYFFFYIQKTSYIADTYLIYFMCSIASSILMSIGLIVANRRLKKLNDLKVMRKELQLFFNT